jgi:predicted phosphodiesterase
MAKIIKRVKFLIMSDTHDLIPSEELSCSFRHIRQEVGVVLHCGDLTEYGTPKAIEDAVRMIGSIDAELRLIIPGNHELALDKDCWIGEGGSIEDHEKAIDIVTGDLSKNCGVTFLKEGTHTFTLNSGVKFTIYASPYTPQCGKSAFQYPTNQDRYNHP